MLGKRMSFCTFDQLLRQTNRFVQIKFQIFQAITADVKQLVLLPRIHGLKIEFQRCSRFLSINVALDFHAVTYLKLPSEAFDSFHRRSRATDDVDSSGTRWFNVLLAGFNGYMKRNYPHQVSFVSDSTSKPYLCGLLIVTSLIVCAYFTRSSFLPKDYGISQERNEVSNMSGESKRDSNCMNKCRPPGSEALPEGIVTKTSNLGMRPLWGRGAENTELKHPANLLAVPVGIKQKQQVNKIVEKFLENDFVVMLFHYDGLVDEWHDLGWSSQVIHIAAANQSKWWFAKRFLHPDIVAEYEYIFLWDEDLGVESFNPDRYVSIVKEEGLEISQPALDPSKSEVHHQITIRRRNSRVHRRYYKYKGSSQCNENSTAPPCLGWVEMMSPVFSRASWRCAWYMIQNDLVHAWGLDFQLGYCAQGDRAIKVGVVDSEYVVHLGLPTLGGVPGTTKSTDQSMDDSAKTKNPVESEAPAASPPIDYGNRSAVRRQSYIEMKIFKSRWDNAVKNDKCWIDPYQKPSVPLVH